MRIVIRLLRWLTTPIETPREPYRVQRNRPSEEWRERQRKDVEWIAIRELMRAETYDDRRRVKRVYRDALRRHWTKKGYSKSKIEWMLNN